MDGDNEAKCTDNYSVCSIDIQIKSSNSSSVSNFFMTDSRTMNCDRSFFAGTCNIIGNKTQGFNLANTQVDCRRDATMTVPRSLTALVRLRLPSEPGLAANNCASWQPPSHELDSEDGDSGSPTQVDGTEGRVTVWLGFTRKGQQSQVDTYYHYRVAAISFCSRSSIACVVAIIGINRLNFLVLTPPALSFLPRLLPALPLTPPLSYLSTRTAARPVCWVAIHSVGTVLSIDLCRNVFFCYKALIPTQQAEPSLQ